MYLSHDDGRRVWNASALEPFFLIERLPSYIRRLCYCVFKGCALSSSSSSLRLGAVQGRSSEPVAKFRESMDRDPLSAEVSRLRNWMMMMILSRVMGGDE